MIKIEMTFPKLEEKFKAIQRDVLLALAASMQTNRAMMFDKDGADNGKPAWAPLVLRSGRPLQDKGVLRKSLAPNNDGLKPGHGRDGIVRTGNNEAIIGTKLAYAAVMNDGTAKMPGGVIRAKNAQALKIPLPSGKRATDSAKALRKGAAGKGSDKFMFRKSVKIPARPMNTVTKEDQQEWSETMANYIASRMNDV